MTCKRRLDGYFRRLKVADLSHQNDIGILAEERSQGRSKVQADLLFHLYLVDTGHLEFHRIFRGQDISIRAVQLGNGGIEGVGLAAARWTSDQNHSIRLEN